MSDILYFLPLVLGIVLYILGREYEDYLLGTLGGIVFFIFGVALLINPLPTISSLTNDLVGHACWAVGLYVFLRGTWEAISGYK